MESLALISSLFYGMADFESGRLTRMVPVVVVAGLTAVASIVFFLVGGVVGLDVEIVGSDLAAGACLGVLYTVANLLLFSALARGPMGVVSATSGVAIAVPLIFDVLTGHVPSWGQWVGIVGILVGVFLVTRRGSTGRFSIRALLMGLAAATLYGSSDIIVKLGTDSNIYGLFLVAELVEVGIYALVILGLRLKIRLNFRIVVTLFALGLLNSSALVIFGYAARAGRIDIVSILASLGPLVIVGLAFLLLNERLGKLQTTGVVVAVAASFFLI